MQGKARGQIALRPVSAYEPLFAETTGMASRRLTMTKNKRKPHPALDVYINATSFRMAADELARLAENDSMYIWPVMVNEALCLELYLKCVRRLRRRYGRTHDIKNFLIA